MNKFLVVFKQEYAQVVKKKSFLIGLILTPAIMFAFMFGPALLARKKSTTTEHLVVIDRSQKAIGDRFRDAIAHYTIEETETPYYNIDSIYSLSINDSVGFSAIEDSIKTLLVEDQLKYYLVIQPDALENDTALYLVSKADNIVSYRRFRWQISRVLAALRLEQAELNQPVDSILDMTREIDLVTKDIKGEVTSFDKKFLIAIAFVMMMYILIFGNGQMVMRSVIDEKNSRIMEVLVSSISPFQLMMGKILGLGAATMTQVLIWIAAGLGIMLGQGGGGDPAIMKLVFNPMLIVYFVLFLITGFLLYSALFALVGSIVSNEKEAQNFLFPIIMCMMLPVMLGVFIIQEPNSMIAMVLSYIPLFAPTMMVMRLNVVLPTLPSMDLFSGILLEANLSMIVMILSVIGMVWVTAKVFRVGILMHGKRATLPEIMKWIKK